MVDVGAKEKPLFELANFVAIFEKRSYKATKKRQSSTNKGNKSESNDDRGIAWGVLEDVVDLGLLAVSRNLRSGDRYIGIALN